MDLMNPKAFKRVPAIDKCFAVLDLLVQSKEPMSISEISGRLGLNKSTVFNMIHTLKNLNVLEVQGNGKFAFGTHFYVLANKAGKKSTLIQVAHPYLEQVNKKTDLSVFLGLRSDARAILIDKVDSAHGIKVASDIGMQMPPLAGAGIKAMLAQLPDEALDEILKQTELQRFTPLSIVNKRTYKEEIREVRKDGIAYDLGEYIEGMVGFAVPVKSSGENVQAAIWAAGLQTQVSEESLPVIRGLLLDVAQEINHRML